MLANMYDENQALLRASRSRASLHSFLWYVIAFVRKLDQLLIPEHI